MTEFMPKRVTRELAEQIADDLFRNGKGDVAVRLQLKIPDWSDGIKAERDGGGLCRGVVVDRIADRLHKGVLPTKLQ